MAVRKGKKVLVTGGSRGIGAEAVRSFSAHGSTVAFFYHRAHQESIALSRETGALNIRCNIEYPESVANAAEVVAEFFDGEIDTLICNAGIADDGFLTDIGKERWTQVINVNLNGTYYCLDAFLPYMIKKGKGSIIIVSSMHGISGASRSVAYSTASAGLIGMTKSLAKELGPYGIRVNCIAPGFIDTEMNKDVSREKIENAIKRTPLGRIGKVEDVVHTMQYLSSDGANFITGQILEVSGGYTI